jgi:hypothetical protein
LEACLPKLAWYQILIIVIAAVSIGVLVANFVITGRDVPGGLLSLLGTIVGAVFATDTINKWRVQNGSSNTDLESSSDTEEVKP